MRTGILVVLSAAWFGLYLWSAGDRSGGMFGGIGPFILCALGFLVLIAVWLCIGVHSLVAKQRLGIVGWLVTPAAIILAWTLPWSSWIFSMQFRAAEPALRQYALSLAQIPEDKSQRPTSDVHGFEFDTVSRRGDTIVLTQARSPDGEFGFIFCPSNTPPTPPSWAVYHSYSPIAPNWFHYHWSND